MRQPWTGIASTPESIDGTGGSHEGTEDFALWCVFWAAWTVLVPAVMLSPQGVAVILAGGGVAAGT